MEELDYKTCVFCGEWNEFSLSPDKALYIITAVVEKYGITEFRSMGRCEFDLALEEAVLTLKQRLPSLVLSFIQEKKAPDIEAFMRYDTMLLPVLEGTDREGIYHWVLDRSHFLLVSTESILGERVKRDYEEKCILDFAQDYDSLLAQLEG